MGETALIGKKKGQIMGLERILISNTVILAASVPSNINFK